MSTMESKKNIPNQLIIWEGEWPQVKGFVTDSRIWAERAVEEHQWGKSFLIQARVAVESCFHTTDSLITHSSSSVSTFIREKPWTPTAALIGTGSAVVTVKSMSRWGFSRGIRNGFVFGGLASACCYPQELRHFIFDFSPGDAMKRFAGE